MKKKLYILLVIVLLIGAFFICYKVNVIDKNTDAYKFKVEYESLNNKESYGNNKCRELNIDKDNMIKYSSAKEVLDKINNNESFIVYFGFAKCPWCRSMIENLLSLAKQNNEVIYYVDVLEIRDTLEVKDGKVVVSKKGDTNYMKLLEKLDEVLDDYSLEIDDIKYETNEKRIYAPNVVAIINGKAVKKVEGVSEKLTNPYGKITDEMKKDSIDQLNCIFKCIEELGVCKKPNAC